MVLEMEIVLRMIAAILNLFGWFYAIQIYLSPAPHGWTWVSVAVGTLIIALGEMGVFFVLYHYNSLVIEWVIFVPPTMLLLVGGPMAILQILKKVKEDRDNDSLERQRKGPDVENC